MLLDAETRLRARDGRVRRGFALMGKRPLRPRWSWRALTVIALVGASLIALRTLHGSLARASAPTHKNPLLSLVRDDSDREALVGRVEERLRAGSYAYHAVRLERDGNQQWAVTLGPGLPVGTRVRVRSFGHRDAFHSPRLGRTFSNLMFGIVTRVETPLN
jgi:hypothetical protein